MSERDTDFDKTIAEIARLTAPGVLGFYTHFELTEIFYVRKGERDAHNVFSVLVAEEREDGAQVTDPRYLGERINLKSLKDRSFGIRQSLRAISDLNKIFEEFRGTGEWRPCGDKLHVGTLKRISTQFVPSNSMEDPALGGVLKNNFWNGSHVIEWMDIEKYLLKSYWKSQLDCRSSRTVSKSKFLYGWQACLTG
jgi:hypothetical protein